MAPTLPNPLCMHVIDYRCPLTPSSLLPLYAWLLCQFPFVLAWLWFDCSISGVFQIHASALLVTLVSVTIPPASLCQSLGLSTLTTTPTTTQLNGTSLKPFRAAHPPRTYFLRYRLRHLQPPHCSVLICSHLWYVVSFFVENSVVYLRLRSFVFQGLPAGQLLRR